jgi:hypothetical protein
MTPGATVVFPLTTPGATVEPPSIVAGTGALKAILVGIAWATETAVKPASNRAIEYVITLFIELILLTIIVVYRFSSKTCRV